MENIILGLLLLQSRTIYQLRRRINSGLNLMYSCSTGSIQAAIKRLLQHDYIYFNETVENGKSKKVYGITDAGRAYFDSWVNSPFLPDTAKNPELSKLYFMGFAEKETRIKTIEKHLTDLREKFSVLDGICKDGEALAGDMRENDIFFYQLQTAKYGRDFIRFNINWFAELSENMRGKK